MTHSRGISSGLSWPLLITTEPSWRPGFRFTRMMKGLELAVGYLDQLVVGLGVILSLFQILAVKGSDAESEMTELLAPLTI
jgi:hypothetical protein